MAVGSRVVVFGKHAATVDAVSHNGKRVHVVGDTYSGWVTADKVKEVAR